MRWFKMFGEARNDAKLRVLTDEQFRTWFNLLCLASEQDEVGVIEGYSDYLLSVEVCGENIELLQSTLEALSRLELIERNSSGIKLLGPVFAKDTSGRLPPHEWSTLRAIVFERDAYTCQYCGTHDSKLECDHVFPVSRGGSNELNNLITACFACNRSKRNKTLKEWLGWP